MKNVKTLQNVTKIKKRKKHFLHVWFVTSSSVNSPVGTHARSELNDIIQRVTVT